MKAYICVYRHGVASLSELEQTRLAAGADSRMHHFLDRYNESDCFYDWGDDPGFFAAEQVFGSAAHASWGVCRPNVRSYLEKGDFVVFFCAKQDATQRGLWDYYLVACATVKDAIGRETLWTDRRYAKHRTFYNVLVVMQANELVHREVFQPPHEDWPHRAEAPYIVFDPELTRVEMRSPLHVARKIASERIERWFSNRADVRRIESLLFDQFEITRRLRTTNPYISHPHIAIHNWIDASAESKRKLLGALRDNLLDEI